MKIKVTCKVCGKEFKVSPSRITEGVKYCSRECMGESYCGESNPSWKGGSIKGICKYCGNVFYLSPGRAKKEKVLFAHGNVMPYPDLKKWNGNVKCAVTPSRYGKHMLLKVGVASVQ